MQIRDSQKAAEKLAGELDVVDDRALDTLRGDETFAAWAYIHRQADLYAADLEQTAAGDEILAAAHTASHMAREVAVTRGAELLDRPLDDARQEVEA